MLLDGILREKASRRALLLGGIWPLMAFSEIGARRALLSPSFVGPGGAMLNIGAMPHLPELRGANWGATIQNAIDAASLAGGGRVYLPAGDYEIGSKLELRSNVILCGDGYSSRLFSTQVGPGQPTVIRAKGIRNFSIENLRIEGSGVGNLETTYAISITDGCYGGRISGCFVSRSYIGIYVGDVSARPSSNIIVSENYIDNIGLNGIGVNSGGGGIRVVNNFISSCGSVATLSNIGAGIEYRSVRGGFCSDNIVVDCSYGGSGVVDGIRLENGSDPEMPDSEIVCSRNIISAFSGCGIRGQMIQNSIISNNIINGNLTSQVGILLYSSLKPNIISREIVLSDNLVKDVCSGHGIRLQGDAEAPVKNCSVRGSVITNCDIGALLVAANQNTFIGNRYGVSRGRGILVKESSNNIFSSEYASGCKIGFQVESGVGNTFLECTAVDNSIYGLVSSPGPHGTFVRGGVFVRNGKDKVLGGR